MFTNYISNHTYKPLFVWTEFKTNWTQWTIFWIWGWYLAFWQPEHRTESSGFIWPTSGRKRTSRGNLKNSLALNICGSFYARTKVPTEVYYSDTVVTITKYQWAQWGLEYGREIWKNDKLRLDLIAGLGHGGLYYYHDEKGNDVKKSSFHFSPGFSLLYPIRRSHIYN